MRPAIVLGVLLVCAGVASAASPGTPGLRPDDPGYVFFPYPLDQIDAPPLWALEAGKPCSVKVAVVDTGFGPTPDLPFGTVFNFADGTGDQDHGEEVASVIGASFNNGIGAAGLAVGCPLLPIRIFDQIGHADGYALEQGINAAAAATPGVRVINLSL
jgi:subtilisin family serine protease